MRWTDFVIWQRRRLGIPHGNPLYRNWTRKEYRLVGKASDLEVARKLGRGILSVRHQRLHLGIPLLTDEARSFLMVRFFRSNIDAPRSRKPTTRSVVPRLAGIRDCPWIDATPKLARMKKAVTNWRLAVN